MYSICVTATPNRNTDVDAYCAVTGETDFGTKIRVADQLRGSYFGTIEHSRILQDDKVWARCSNGNISIWGIFQLIWGSFNTSHPYVSYFRALATNHPINFERIDRPLYIIGLTYDFLYCQGTRLTFNAFLFWVEYYQKPQRTKVLKNFVTYSLNSQCNLKGEGDVSLSRKVDRDIDSICNVFFSLALTLRRGV